MASLIIYEGASRIDGSPIVGIITHNSSNRKTGSMDQLWVLPRDVNPVLAIKSGEDRGVCGDCPHRPALGGTCYVTVVQAPNVIWKQYAKLVAGEPSKYERVPFHEIREKVRGYAIRLGAYGDPAALPVELLEEIVAGYVRHTGYTHQWERFPEVGKYCMASADSVSDLEKARKMGLRSFRVTTSYDTLQEGEIICPNDTTGVKCIACGLCNGTGKAKDIVILVHGKNHKKFKETVPSDMVMGA